jgi:hypothetical protein
MKGCILNDDGTVNYYLSPSDWTKKLDGITPSNLDGSDGQVMVEIPAFYYSYSYNSGTTTHTWNISPYHPKYSLHQSFTKNGSIVNTRYVGAYPAVLYNSSLSGYTNGLYLTTTGTTFSSTGNTITQVGRTNPFTSLQVGDKIKITGTISNNSTFTVSVTGDTIITVSETLTSETSLNTVIQNQMNTSLGGDKLGSVSGKIPIIQFTRGQGRNMAKNRGIGWRQMDYALLHAIQILFLVEYGSFYSQSVLGAGVSNVGDWLTYNDYNPFVLNGNGNSLGNGSGNNAGGSTCAVEKTKYLKWRGIEHPYANIYKWIDGININNNVPYVCNVDTQFADDTSTNYTNLGVTLCNVNGWQKTISQSSMTMLPLTIGGTSSTFITDYYYQSSGWLVFIFGAGSFDGSSCGFWCSFLNYSSSILSRSIGSWLVF